MPGFIAAFLKYLNRIEAVVAALAYAIVAGLLLGEIVAREIFLSAIWGSQKMAVFGAIIAGFLGLCLATAANSHLRPQFADGWWPSSWQPTIGRIGDVVSAVIFLALAGIAAIYVSDTIASQDRAAVLYILLWPIQLVLPYAFFSCSLRHLIFAIQPALKPVNETPEG